MRERGYCTSSLMWRLSHATQRPHTVCLCLDSYILGFPSLENRINLYCILKDWYTYLGTSREYCNACVCTQSLSYVWLFCGPMDCGPPGSSVHRILQARILEWVAISFSRGSSWPRGQTCISCGVSCIAGRFFTAESPGEADTVINSGINKDVSCLFCT